MFFVYLFQHGLLRIIVINGIIGVKGQMRCFKAQNSGTERMEGAHPKGAHGNFKEVLKAFLKLAGGFVGEGDHQDFPGWNLQFFDKVGSTVNNRFSFARTRSGEYQDGILGISNNL